jgi:hypothetical protein
MCTTRPICDIEKIKESFIFVVSRTIFLKTNNFRRIRCALLAYVRCGGLALKGLISSSVARNEHVNIGLLNWFNFYHMKLWVTQWCSWLMHHTTSWNVTGSIPDGVTGIFHWHNPSGHPVALGSTHPLTETSTTTISKGVKAAGA